MKKQDVFLGAGILALALVLYGLFRLLSGGEGAYALVSVGGREQGRYSLEEDLELDIAGADGGYNHLSIQDGVVSVTEADCPDKLCVYQKSIRYSGEMIVCLPHQLVIEIQNGQEASLDGIAQ